MTHNALATSRDSFDLDRAICVYLGGPPDSAAINLKNQVDRLNAEFGADAQAIKIEIDRKLDSFAKPAARKGVPSGHSLASWIAQEMPDATDVCRDKIAVYVEIYVAR